MRATKIVKGQLVAKLALDDISMAEIFIACTDETVFRQLRDVIVANWHNAQAHDGIEQTDLFNKGVADAGK